jgi:hypothetical protein
MGTKTWGSFESWSSIIPPAIVYAGGADPMGARPELLGVADGEASALTALLEGWARLAPRGISAKGAIEALYPREPSGAPDGFQDMREAIEELTRAQPGRPPSAHRLGNVLRKKRRRVVAGRMLDCEVDRTGVAKWTVMSREGAGTAGTCRDSFLRESFLGGEEEKTSRARAGIVPAVPAVPADGEPWPCDLGGGDR